MLNYKKRNTRYNVKMQNFASQLEYQKLMNIKNNKQKHCTVVLRCDSTLYSRAMARLNIEFLNY